MLSDDSLVGLAESKRGRLAVKVSFVDAGESIGKLFRVGNVDHVLARGALGKEMSCESGDTFHRLTNFHITCHLKIGSSGKENGSGT